ncbi:MAG TPA: hypothetical protein VF912_08335 [Anaeromyxobacter sp.]
MTKRDPGKHKGAEPPVKPGEPRPGDERRGPDWEPANPEWSPPGRPRGEEPPAPGQPAKKGDDVGPGPAKLGDPPIEEGFGKRSRHGADRKPPPDPDA